MSLVTPYRMDPAESVSGPRPIRMPRRRGRRPEDGSPSPTAKKTPRRVSESSHVGDQSIPADREQWLQLHCDELIRRLQEWEDELTRRESELNDRESRLERRQRRIRIAGHAAETDSEQAPSQVPAVAY